MTDTTPDFEPALSQEQFFEKLTTFDPLSDLSGPWSGTGLNTGRAFPPVTMDAFSPETRDRINARLRAVHPADHERMREQFIREEMGAAGIEARVMADPGANATNYARICTQQENTRRINGAEIARLQRELAEHNMTIDPATGQPAPLPSMRIEGQRRTAMENRILELQTQISLVDGQEGEFHRREAMEQDWIDYMGKQLMAHELAEAKKRAEKKLSEERIEKLAEGFAKRDRPVTG